MKAVTSGNVSAREVQEIIYDLNEDYAWQYVNENSSSFHLNYLSWSLRDYLEYRDLNEYYLDEYHAAISNAKSNSETSLSKEELYRVMKAVNEVEERKIIDEVNLNLPNISEETIKPLFLYVQDWVFPYFIRELVKIKAENQRDLTLTDFQNARGEANLDLALHISITSRYL